MPAARWGLLCGRDTVLLAWSVVTEFIMIGTYSVGIAVVLLPNVYITMCIPYHIITKSAGPQSKYMINDESAHQQAVLDSVF